MNISRDISISSLNTLFYDSDVVAMEMISVFDSIVDGYKYTVYTHTAQQTTINKNKIQNLLLMLPLLCTIIRQSTTRAFAVDTKLQQKCVLYIIQSSHAPPSRAMAFQMRIHLPHQSLARENNIRML